MKTQKAPTSSLPAQTKLLLQGTKVIRCTSSRHCCSFIHQGLARPLLQARCCQAPGTQWEPGRRDPGSCGIFSREEGKAANRRTGSQLPVSFIKSCNMRWELQGWERRKVYGLLPKKCEWASYGMIWRKNPMLVGIPDWSMCGC